jgi:hypothetical protein
LVQKRIEGKRLGQARIELQRLLGVAGEGERDRRQTRRLPAEGPLDRGGRALARFAAVAGCRLTDSFKRHRRCAHFVKAESLTLSHRQTELLAGLGKAPA